MTPGTKLGPYEILSKLGAGGMGEVYRAHDSRLGRDLAIKVSAEQFTERFEREARAVAALNHPNICALYDVGPNYLVMELIEGESPRGPLPLDEVLRIARQIADALEAAHEKGIVHRDLKPANIKIKPDGTVKVLDFGLATLGAVAGTDPAESPTMLSTPTQPGMILGTAAYMSPEQARGKQVDKRADIWAFGVVLYELLTGERPFHGDDIAEVLASVMKDQPDLSRVPPQVQRLLQSCLEKDHRKRLRDIGDAWRLLEDAPVAPQAAPSRPRLSWVIAAMATAAALALGFLYFRKPIEEPRVIRFSVPPPEKAAFAAYAPAVSPDGRRLALVVTSAGPNSIWLRNLDSLAFQALPGTEDAREPFWSPDSRFLAFYAGSRLKKIDLSVPSTPSPAITVCDCNTTITGGSWSTGDVILFTPGSAPGGLFRIPAGGGTLTPVTHIETGVEIFHAVPWFLPDGRRFLYMAEHSDTEDSTMYLGSLDSKVRQAVFTGKSLGVYAAPGYLLFVRDRLLMAQPFNASKGQITGDPVAIVAEPVGFRVNGLPLFSSSQNGVLAYASGAATGNVQLTWLDRTGKPLGAIGQPSPVLFEQPAISPDGNTVAFETNSFDISLHDLSRGGDTRFTFTPGQAGYPVWSPDGGQIAFSSGLGRGGSILYQRPTGGQAQDVALDSDARAKRPADWSRDGRYIIEDSQSAQTGKDIWVLPLFGDRKPFPYLHTQFNETEAKLSPDGHWLAYVSDESKRNEVYVNTFPNPGTNLPISISGGDRPVWSRDGKELYFISADQKMMAVDIKPGASFEYGAPKPLFDVRIEPTGSFAVAKDGRFLVPVPAEQGAGGAIHVVVNWPAELKK